MCMYMYSHIHERFHQQKFLAIQCVNPPSQFSRLGIQVPFLICHVFCVYGFVKTCFSYMYMYLGRALHMIVLVSVVCVCILCVSCV